MSITITVDEAHDQFINLGPNAYFYQAMHEMADLAPSFYSTYPDLSALPQASEDPGDCHRDWLKDAQTQAKSFMDKYRSKLSNHTQWLLNQLIQGGS